MEKTLSPTCDGEVLGPDSPADLKPHRRYVITVRDEEPAPRNGDAWDVLGSLVGTVVAPPDWASQHDHYLYGVCPNEQHT